MKVLLAVRSVASDSYDAHVVAEVGDAATATSLKALLGKRLVTVNSDDVVTELTAQPCRQRGLSTVFRELLDFDGDEPIAIAEDDDLFNRDGSSVELRPARAYGAHLATSFAQVVATASSVGHSAIGFRRASTGEVVVNPAKSAAPGLSIDDDVLVIAAGSPVLAAPVAI